MKFLQFYRDGRPTLGVITEKGVVDMSAHPELPQTMLALCQSGDTAALAALDGPYLDEESLTLAPVVTGMEKILCIGLNYRAHAAECGIPLPENPTVFCKLPNALAAHGQAIALPAAEEIVKLLTRIHEEGYDGVIAVMLSGGLSGTSAELCESGDGGCHPCE